MLETETTLAEIHFSSNASVHHPLQRAVDGGAADSVVFVADEIDEIVGAEMSLLPEEHVHDLLALAGALAPRRLEFAEILEGSTHVQVKSQKSKVKTTDL
jgi:hypothetical protein